MTSCRAARQIKPLFRLVHQRHHQNGSNVTALGTAFGDAADIGLCFVAFHGLLVLALWALPRWNIVHVVALIGFEVQVPLWPVQTRQSKILLVLSALPCPDQECAHPTIIFPISHMITNKPDNPCVPPQVATNITGHCGYELPLWLHAVVTAGVGLTPLAATSKTHYIHHLDPRFNKVRAALQCGSQLLLWRENDGLPQSFQKGVRCCAEAASHSAMVAFLWLMCYAALVAKLLG